MARHPVKELTDSELLDLLQQGDHAAYAEIYDRYIFKILHHTFRITRDREQAKDIIQEVFAKLWTNRGSLRVTTNLAGFLYTSARNLVLNEFSHKEVQNRYYDSLLQFAAAPQVDTDHQVREKQLTAIIEREIAALPPKMREVFELSRKQHLSHKEIAERLDISEATVSRHISNALKQLRVKLGLFTFLIFWLGQSKFF